MKHASAHAPFFSHASKPTGNVARIGCADASSRPEIHTRCSIEWLLTRTLRPTDAAATAPLTHGHTLVLCDACTGFRGPGRRQRRAGHHEAAMYMTYHRGGNWGADSKNQKMRKIKRLVRATTRPPALISRMSLPGPTAGICTSARHPHSVPRRDALPALCVQGGFDRWRISAIGAAELHGARLSIRRPTRGRCVARPNARCCVCASARVRGCVGACRWAPRTSAFVAAAAADADRCRLLRGARQQPQV